MIAGQSNAVGQGYTLNHYSFNGVVAALFKKSPNLQVASDRWVDLKDPTGADDASALGSVWPLVATSHLSRTTPPPIAFIPTAVNSSAIASWQLGQANYNAMAASITRSATPIKAVLWWQGEQDASLSMSQAQYHTYLAALAGQIATDFGVPLMVAKIQSCTGIAPADTARIVAAQAAAWSDIPNVIPGPDLSDMVTDDAFHFRIDAKMQTAAARWWAAMVAAGF